MVLKGRFYAPAGILWVEWYSRTKSSPVSGEVPQGAEESSTPSQLR